MKSQKSKRAALWPKNVDSRPWWAQRYTLHDLILALIALIWSFICLIVIVFDKESDQVWIVMTAIITYYFTRKNESRGRTETTGSRSRGFSKARKPRKETKDEEGSVAPDSSKTSKRQKKDRE